VADRNLYLNNGTIEESLDLFASLLGKQQLVREPVLVDVKNSLGLRTAQPVFALANSPLRDCAAMDGIAVISAKTQGAGESRPLELAKGEFEHIDTGDPIYTPFDAVIMAEDIVEGNGGRVIIRAAAAPWQHVRPVGEDIVQGEMILPRGHAIRPFDIGALLSGGISEVLVYPKPTAAIIPTGTELVEIGGKIEEDSIIDSNSWMLAALVEEAGGAATRLPIVADDLESIKKTLLDAAGSHDIVLVSAGTSAGREDYTVRAISEIGQVAVHGVAMKPGKPVILAIVEGKPVIGIPGYPVSAYLAYDTFVAPVLGAMANTTQASAQTVKATLSRKMVSSLKYREYVRVKVGDVNGRLVASPLERGAGAAMSLVRADGFCIIGQESEGLEAGSEVDVLLCRSLEELGSTVVSIGSHDLILDVIADLLPNLYPGNHLSSVHVGSMGGLLALRNNEAHIAPTHLLDEATGAYNVPAIKTMFAGVPMALIKGVGRVQGIMAKAGNPLGITGIESLPDVRFVNRQRGAGTRLLFDFLLKNAGIPTTTINGYGREAATHMALAAAVKGPGADAGIGVLSAANAMGLDFIPVGVEEYDFAIHASDLEKEHVRCFIEVLKHPQFHMQLEALGGYSAGRCGEVEIIG